TPTASCVETGSAIGPMLAPLDREPSGLIVDAMATQALDLARLSGPPKTGAVFRGAHDARSTATRSRASRPSSTPPTLPNRDRPPGPLPDSSGRPTRRRPFTMRNQLIADQNRFRCDFVVT